MNSLSSRELSHMNPSLNRSMEERQDDSCADICTDSGGTVKLSCKTDLKMENPLFVGVQIKLEREDPLLIEPGQTDDLDPQLQIQYIKQEKYHENLTVNNMLTLETSSLTHSTTIFPCSSPNLSLDRLFDLKPCQIVLERVNTGSTRECNIRKKGSEKCKISYTCDYCQEIYLNKVKFRKHILSHLKESGSRQDCCPAFDSPEVQNQHLLSTHSNQVEKQVNHWQCKHCKKLFFQRYSFVRHSRKTSRRASTKLKCHLCDLSYSAECSLRKHCVTHHKGKFVCNVCGTVLTDHSNLNRHLHSVHRLSTKYKTLPLPTCEVCDRSFTRRDYLKVHFRKEHNDSEPNRKVSQSPPMLLSKQRFSLNQKHLQSGKILHKCKQCGALFNQKAHLTRHEHIHSGIKCVCDVCDQTFSDPSSLRRHNIVQHSKRRWK